MNITKGVITALSIAGSFPAMAQTKPNVLIILMDDAGYTNFGFNGAVNFETPCIDSLSREGVICTDAHVMASVSAPSRASIITGQYAQRFGFECNLDNPKGGIPQKIETIGDVFKQAGYRTAALGKWHLGDLADMRPNNQGFDYFCGFLSGARSYYYHPDKDDKDGNAHQLQENGHPCPFSGYLTDVLTDKAIEYIKDEPLKPFMMYLAYNAVHTPLEAPQADLDHFSGSKVQKIAALAYAADRAIGRLVNFLKKEKIFDNTLIFFLSDNGGAVNNLSSNLPFKGFKGNKFEGGTRVPYFVVWKNRIGGTPQKCDGLVSSLDIMATALNAAGIDRKSLKQPIDGVDLIPYLSGKKKGSPHEVLFWRKLNAMAVRTPHYKRIEVTGIGKVLYDMVKDPYETHNIIESNKSIDNKMSKMYKKWASEMMPPAWIEGGGWPAATDTIHLDLMDNKKPRRYGP